MKDRKLTQLIMLFSKQEMEQLGRFIQSPFFNSQDKLITLFAFFSSHYPNFDEKEFSEEAAWEALYPGTSLEKNRLAQYMTRLAKLIDTFIAVQEFLEDDVYPWQFKSRFFLKKRSGYFTEKLFKDFSKAFKKLKPKTPDDFNVLYQATLDQHNYWVINSQSKKGLDYSTLQFSLDQLYIIEKLRLATIAKMADRTPPNHHEGDFIKQVYDYASEQLDQLPPLAIIWHHAYHLLLHPDSETAYHDLKRYWLMHLHELSSNANVVIATLLEQMVPKVFLNRRSAYMEELFSIYLMVIQQNWLVQEGLVQHLRFNNIVFVALYLRKPDWARDFILSHREYLVPEFQEAVYAYNMARVDFYNRDFSNCLKRIAGLEFVDPYMVVGSKRMQLKCYYEQEEFEMMESAINALRVYLHRLKGASEFFKDHHQFFTNVLNRLYKIKTMGTRQEALEKVREEVSARTSIPEYDWILEKINELRSI